LANLDLDARVRHAANLLKDPILFEAFETVEAEAINAWASTGAAQQQEREWAFLMLKAVRRVRGNLEGVIAEGKIAAQPLMRAVR
jgi:hypothetical protein